MTLFSRLPSRLSLRCFAAKPQCYGPIFCHQKLNINVPRNLLRTRINLRHASNVTSRPAATKVDMGPSVTKAAYPARLLIFHSPAFEATSVGACKLACLGIFAMGCLVVAPNVYQFGEPESLWWSIPAVIIATAMPLPFIHVMTRPYVTNIFIETPAWARRSKDSLVSFVRRIPPDTRLEIETMGFLPWPRTQTLQVSELRNVPSDRGSMFRAPINLERITQADEKSKVPKGVRWSLSQFYARPTPSRWLKSRAPEVWPLVMEFVARNSAGSASKRPVSSALGAREVRYPVNVQTRTPTPAAPVLKNHQRKK